MTIGSLNSALNAATAGLQAAQYGIDVVSQNISNANTAGYTRKTSEQSVIIGPDGSASVTNDPIQRSVNATVQQEYFSATSAQSASDTTSSYLNNLITAFGAPSGATSASGNAANSGSTAGLLSNLSDAFTALQENPADITLQSSAVSAAQSLAQNLNSVSAQVNTLSTNSEQDISNAVSSVNSTLNQIQSCNQQIELAQSQGQSTANLDDQVDTLVQTLSQSMNITYFTNSNGAVYVNTSGGQALVDNSVHPLDFTVQPVSATTTGLNGVTVDGTDITSQITSGQLGALFTLRNTTLPQAQAQLDELSGVMTSQFNSAGVQLFTDPSNANFTYPADTVGLASRITVNPSVVANPWQLRDGTAASTPSTATGNTTIIDNVINNVFSATQNFRTTNLGAGGNLSSGINATATLGDYATSFVTYQAAQSSAATTDDTNQQATASALQTQLQNGSGVSLDAELSNLIVLQNAYGASAKMVTAIQTLFTTLMSAVQ